jgi:hypothetical protein
MSRRRRVVAFTLGLGTIATSFAVLESPAQALSSPVVAVAVAGLASVVTIDRQERSTRGR